MIPEAVTVVHNVPHAAPWGLPVAQYFFLSGLSAGAFVVCAAAALWAGERLRNAAHRVAWMVFLLGLIAPLGLVLDLEQPLRAWHLFVWFNPRSPISWGVWLLSGHLIVSALYAWSSDNRALAVVGLPLALGVAGYTGALLAAMQARPLWATPLLPLLFVLSALASGLALHVLAAALSERGPLGSNQGDSIIPSLARALRWLLLLGLCFGVAHLALLATGAAEAKLAAAVSLATPLFTLGSALVGHVAPLAILLWPGALGSRRWPAVAAAMALAGAYCLRLSLLAIGQAIPLT